MRVASKEQLPRLPARLPDENATESDRLGDRLHLSPGDEEPLWRVPICSAPEIAVSCYQARQSLTSWADWTRQQRGNVFLKVARRLEKECESLARQIAIDTGKPISDARSEVAFGINLLRSAVEHGNSAGNEDAGNGWWWRRRPLGVVAIITPWNNPLAIPLGKLVPALLFGNAVVWKPAIPGASIAVRVFDLLSECGLPSGVANIVQGDRETADMLMNDGHVDAVTLTGSLSAGYAAQVNCARRFIPLQAELGGNNAAIVWSDAELDAAARQIARGGFGAAGQRCTANRRVIVAQPVHDEFVRRMRTAMRQLPFGDPLDDATVVGPVISREAQNRIASTIDRARHAGAEVYTEHAFAAHGCSVNGRGNFIPPTLICCAEPGAEIVQDETFGPVVVVQSASDWGQAIQLCNGVRQGLVAAIFTDSRELQRRFLAEAEAGLLKINLSTAGAAGEAPFGGWKASGIGPPEHGTFDIEFYTRPQTVYESE